MPDFPPVATDFFWALAPDTRCAPPFNLEVGGNKFIEFLLMQFTRHALVQRPFLLFILCRKKLKGDISDPFCATSMENFVNQFLSASLTSADLSAFAASLRFAGGASRINSSTSLSMSLSSSSMSLSSLSSPALL